MIAPDRRIICRAWAAPFAKIRGTMLWVAALLALIIWILGLASGFLGFGIHVFLLAALIAGLAALLPPAHRSDSDRTSETASDHASSVPGSAPECAPIATADTDADCEAR